MRDAYILSNVGRALYRRYQTTRDLADLNEAARMWQDAADAAPDGSAIHTSCLVHLGNVARSRFAEYRVARDGEQAIALYRARRPRWAPAIPGCRPC